MEFSECKRCGKKFMYDYLLVRHLNNVRECTHAISDLNRDVLKDTLTIYKSCVIINNTKYYVCKFCDRKYRSASSKSKHQKTCKLNTALIKIDVPKTSEQLDNIINNSTINNSTIINSNNISNDNNITINQNILNFSDVSLINSLIKHYDINNFILPFPTYTIGHLLDHNFGKLNTSIQRCKEADKNPSTSHHSKYSLVLDLFKEILSVDDYRTKNIYINQKTDNVAYCLLDGKFYAIQIEDLFNIIFQHLPGLINHLKNIKDKFNGMNNDDKDYTEFACQNFTDFIKNDDKTFFKQQIIDCIYNNKLVLNELLNTSKPLDTLLLNNNDLRTLNINTTSINKLRKSIGIMAKDPVTYESINIEQRNIKHRSKSTIQLIDSEPLNEQEYKIEIDYEDTINKIFPDGKIYYKTKFKGMDIWYNEDYELGCLFISKNDKLINKKKLCDFINNLINHPVE